MAGRFITFEGGEGAGKTTQLRRLAAWLEARGIEVVATREPGGTPGAEAIRRLLVEGEAARWDAMSELLLFAAARHDHLERLVLPSLQQDSWVLCDRYIDSTRVYQGLAGRLGLERVDRLHRDLLQARMPDLTLLLDIDAREGFHRLGVERSAARFETKGIPYHQSVRDGFRRLAGDEPERFAVIDAVQEVDEVALQICDCVARRFLSS